MDLPRRKDDLSRHKHRACVRRWPTPGPGSPGLPAEAKNVWLYLEELAGGTLRAVVVHAANVGRECGLTERAARRALETLKRWGLIDVPDRFRGEITIYLQNPLVAARARLVRAASIGQGELDFPEDPELPSEGGADWAAGPAQVIHLPPAVPTQTPAADKAPHPPAGVAPHPPPHHGSSEVRARIDHQSSIIPSKDERSLQSMGPGGHGATPAASSTAFPQPRTLEEREWERVRRETMARRQRETPEPEDGPRPLDFGRVLRPPAGPEALEAVAKWAAYIKAEVRDKEMADWIPERVAYAVVAGRLSEKRLRDILRYTQRNGKSRGAYFFSSLSAEFVKLRLSWKD